MFFHIQRAVRPKFCSHQQCVQLEQRYQLQWGSQSVTEYPISKNRISYLSDTMDTAAQYYFITIFLMQNAFLIKMKVFEENFVWVDQTKKC